MLANLRALFGHVAAIIFLKRGPESLPASTALLVAAVALFVGVTALIGMQMFGIDPNWPIELVLVTSYILAWYRITLTLARKPERFLQVATAWFAVRALFAPVIFPAAATLNAQLQHPETASAALALMVLALMVWALVIDVNIARTAFEWSIPKSLGYMLLQGFVFVVLVALVFGTPVEPA